MASIEKRSRHDGRVSRRTHYRSPSGEQRNKTFDRKADPERFLASVESAKNTGAFVDPVLARITVGDWATHWLDNQTHIKPSTHERYAVHQPLPKWPRHRLLTGARIKGPAALGAMQFQKCSSTRSS